MLVRPVTERDLGAVQAFLRSNAETSLFLASNLARHGPLLTDALFSGNFKVLVEDGEIICVFCLTRRGNLLAEAGGRPDLAEPILDACADEPITIRGVVGEWTLASEIWRKLVDGGDLAEEWCSKERLYRLGLDPRLGAIEPSANTRPLGSADYAQWIVLNDGYFVDVGLDPPGTIEQRRAKFLEQADDRCWWGFFDQDTLISIGGLNAVHDTTGQIGGVYTIADSRRRGFARAVMLRLIADSIRIHGLSKLILFTGHRSPGAAELYESLGFERIGDFALLFGTPR